MEDDTTGYDWAANVAGSFADAIAEIGRRVRAGEPVPTTGYFGRMPQKRNYFPITVSYADRKEIEQVDSPEDIRNGVPFIVISVADGRPASPFEVGCKCPRCKSQRQ